MMTLQEASVEEDRWWGMGGIGLEGNPAANALAMAADFVLHVGTRLTDFATASQSIFGHPNVRFASINVVDRDARKQGAGAATADARLALAALRGAARAAGARPRAEWQAQAEGLKAQWRAPRAPALAPSGDGPMTQGAVIGLRTEARPPGQTIIAPPGGPARAGCLDAGPVRCGGDQR